MLRKVFEIGRKHAFKFFMSAVTLVAATVFISTSVESLWYVPDTEVPVPEAVQPQEGREVSLGEHPIRLRVPALGIDTHVQHVGVNASGNMAAPNNFTDVGWYRYGAVPGFVGSAVIAGHVDNGLALPGVFKELHKLALGDDIYVEKSDGTELHFKVSEMQVYPYTHVPLKILFLRNDLPRLNLVTCEGSWLSSERSYDQRLIVYTELVLE